MKIKKSDVVRVIKEELHQHLKNLFEKHEVVDAHQDKKDDEEDENGNNLEQHADPDNISDKPKSSVKPSKSQGNNDNLEDPEDEITSDSRGKGIGDELVGRTIQSMSLEPKSKVLPGAIEIVFTFREITEPLRILVTKSGQAKFLFKGLKDTLDGGKSEND